MHIIIVIALFIPIATPYKLCSLSQNPVYLRHTTKIGIAIAAGVREALDSTSKWSEIEGKKSLFTGLKNMDPKVSSSRTPN